MEFTDVREWLDAIIESKKKLESLQNFNNSISICSNSVAVHVYEGIEIMAGLLGEELRMKPFDDDEYPYQYSFQYKEIEVFQLSKERIEQYAGAD